MTNLEISKTNIACIVLALSCLIVSCKPDDPSRIVGRYKALTLYFGDTRTVSLAKEFSEGSSGSGESVPPNIFAVGHNEDFIIVKQHPTNGHEGGYKMDTTITNYYIVDMNFKVHQAIDEEIGPLTQHQFDSLRTLYKITDIQFDQFFK